MYIHLYISPTYFISFVLLLKHYLFIYLYFLIYFVMNLFVSNKYFESPDRIIKISNLIIRFCCFVLYLKTRIVLKICIYSS